MQPRINNANSNNSFSWVFDTISNNANPVDFLYTLTNTEEWNLLKDASDKDGNTILHFVCERGDIELIRYLVGYGCDVQARNLTGFAPSDLLINFMLNFSYSEEDIQKEINYLTELGRTYKIYAAVKTGQQTKSLKPGTTEELCDAITAFNQKQVENLINNGTNINGELSAGSTPGAVAVIRKNKPALEYILKYAETMGIEIAKVYGDKKNLLHLALSLPDCHQESIHSLLDMRPDYFYEKTASGLTPLDIAKAKNNGGLTILKNYFSATIKEIALENSAIRLKVNVSKIEGASLEIECNKKHVDYLRLKIELDKFKEKLNRKNEPYELVESDLDQENGKKFTVHSNLYRDLTEFLDLLYSAKVLDGTKRSEITDIIFDQLPCIWRMTNYKDIAFKRNKVSPEKMCPSELIKKMPQNMIKVIDIEVTPTSLLLKFEEDNDFTDRLRSELKSWNLLQNGKRWAFKIEGETTKLFLELNKLFDFLKQYIAINGLKDEIVNRAQLAILRGNQNVNRNQMDQSSSIVRIMSNMVGQSILDSVDQSNLQKVIELSLIQTEEEMEAKAIKLSMETPSTIGMQAAEPMEIDEDKEEEEALKLSMMTSSELAKQTLKEQLKIAVPGYLARGLYQDLFNHNNTELSSDSESDTPDVEVSNRKGFR